MSGSDWWYGRAPATSDVRYVEFMGKDNVPFHTVGFPCTLFGVNESEPEPWKLVDQLKGFNWLNYYGGKFSTSQQARRVHGHGAGDSAGRLLALLPDGQCAGKLRIRISPGSISPPW